MRAVIGDVPSNRQGVLIYYHARGEWRQLGGRCVRRVQKSGDIDNSMVTQNGGQYATLKSGSNGNIATGRKKLKR
jgi:hypothetical protein